MHVVEAGTVCSDVHAALLEGNYSHKGAFLLVFI